MSKYDSTYSAIKAVNEALGYEALNYDSTYDAALALLLNLGGEDKHYDSLYSIMVELATMAENGEIGGGGGSSKLEIDLVESITENGQSVYTPDEGSVYKSVMIDVNVPIPTFETQIKEISIVDNGVVSVTPDQGYNGLSKVDITVNVPTSGGTNYSYKIGMADEAGLRAIGWDDESIGVYRDNNLQYAWRVNDFTVSDENKSLYGVVTADTDMYKVEGMKYCPMIDTSGKTSMSAFFSGCSNLNSIPLLDTSSATNMYGFFRGCSNLNSIPQLDTSSATDMDYFFNGCSNLTSIPQLDTSNVTIMDNFFQGCKSLTSIPQLDTSSATSMVRFFQDCTSLTSIPQLVTSSATRMDYFFSGCSNLTSIPQLDTSSATNMNNFFYNCSNLTSIPQLDTSNLTIMDNFFNGCSNLTSIPQLDTSSATSMYNFFYNCSNLTSIPQLDAGSVTNTGAPFGYSVANKIVDIDGFDKLKVSWTSNAFDRTPNLTVESLMNIINGLWDWTDYPDGKAPLNDGTIYSFGTTHTLKFGTTNLAKLSADQIAIATNKGWTLT